MSFILRTVDEQLINYHTHLGDTYTVVNRERSPEYFEKLLKRDPFGGDSKKAFVHVSYAGNYQYIQEGEHAYIMTSNGETFENITPPKRILPTNFKMPKFDTVDSCDMKPKSWLKLEKATAHKLCISQENKPLIVTHNEFGRNTASFLNVQKEMHDAGYCMIFPTYNGEFIIVGYTARLYESDIMKKIGSRVQVLSQVDSNGQYYVIKLDEVKGEFLVSDEIAASRVGYGLLLDREIVHSIVSER